MYSQQAPRSTSYHDVQNSSLQKNNLNNTVSNIPFSEIIRIKQRTQLDNSYNEIKLREKQELQQKCKDRIAKWPNTIHAIRKKKDQVQYEKFVKDEQERRRMDQEEAQFQAQVKKEILDKANKQIFQTNDRIRAFQSKILLVDTLKEREEQKNLKEQIKVIENLKSQDHYQQLMENLQKYDETEALKKQNELKKINEFKEVIASQHQESIQNQLKRYQENKIEGQLIKENAKQEQDEKQREKIRRKENIIKMNKDIQENNETKAKFDDQKQKEEDELDKQIQEFKNKKDHLIQIRKIREEEKLRLKSLEIDKMYSTQLSLLVDKEKIAHELFLKQVREINEKQAEVERKKQEYQTKLKTQVIQYRDLSYNSKQLKIENEKQNSNEIQRFSVDLNSQLGERDRQRNDFIRSKRKVYSEYNTVQILENQKKREESFSNELKEFESQKTKLETENNQFTSWAERAIDHYKKAGNNIEPLLNELKSQRNNR